MPGCRSPGFLQSKENKMADFIPNAIMLYRSKENGVEIEGKSVEYRVFDKDSPSFDADSVGWVAYIDMIGDAVKIPEEMSKAELVAKLTELGVEFDKTSKKADLALLLTKSIEELEE
jgi:hypothetical protein